MQNRNGKAANLADVVNISDGKKWAAAKVARKSPSDINQQRAGKDLSTELKSEFEVARKEFLDTPQNIPIANLSVRLQRLENQYQKHGKNRVAALSILKQAAEDMGGKYTNRQEITGKDGEALQTTVVHATQDQVEAAVKKAQEEY